MHNAQLVFQKNIKEANGLGAIYDHLTEIVQISEPFDDLLRYQLVYSVSAFDKLIHDLIRIGMVQIFEGLRPTTPKYANEGIALQHLTDLAPGATPPPGVKFEELVRGKLSIQSFQDPTKVSEGLSFIWNESQKWQTLGAKVGLSDKDAKLNLKLIVTRRNAIVHEADLDPITSLKQPITRTEAEHAAKYLLNLGNAVCDLVI
ncbi:HEPN domain-containing protein [Pseudomonas putida]|uniref:HEPN domain-containing protein n=1 Tax=Pseudomonas putida TaxID=303 RepID=UPI00235D2DA8|nr:HEPN domain-containing protein [Pseudomonas putida]GLO24202.1 hypothetical protein PPUJ21368_20300 [Pseudomonas putida]HDS0967723.1 hypothetical protein [Pseudomonas putida]